MAREGTKTLLVRGGKAWADKDLWRDLLEEAYELGAPMINPYDTNNTRGGRKKDRVFDSTLQQSWFRFSSRFQSEMTPPLQKWGNVIPGPLMPPKFKEEVEADLEVLRDVFFAILAASNWDTAVHEYYIELGLGTAAMLVLEGDDDSPVTFIVVPQPFFALEEGPNGGISAVFRKRKMAIRNIEPTWRDAFQGDADSKPDGWDLWVEEKGDQKVEVQEMTYKDFDTGVWYYDVIINDNVANSGSDVFRIVARTYKENPWIVSRWSKNAFEVQGRGPVLHALPDAKVLNRTKELILKNASMAIAGVWTAVDDGVLNPRTIVIKPGAVIPVAANGGGRGASLQSLTSGVDFSVAQLVVEDHQMSIKRALFDDQLPPETGAVRSATEIIQRAQELQSMIESPFARIHQEFIRPLFRRVFSIMGDKGLLGKYRNVNVDGAFIEVQMTSQLAQAENIKSLNNYVQMLELSQTLLGEQVTQLAVKVEDGPKFMGDRLGVSPTVFRTKTERQLLQQQAQAQLAAEQEAQVAQPQDSLPVAV